MAKNKFNKKIAIWSVAIIVVLLVGALVYYNTYYPKKSRESEVQNFKKEFYKSVICEYSCPLKEQLYQNKTQLIPNLDCVKGCTKDFRALGNLNLTNSEALSDNLLKDIEAVVINCKTLSINDKTMTFNNSNFFKCSADELPKISESGNYSYLK